MKLFAISATVALASIDCNDGNNGGCSHSCKSGACECPSCWELTSDNLTCQPEAGKASISCNSAGMSISVDPCVVDPASSITLVDSSCSYVTGDDGNYELATALDECGTEYTVNADDDSVIFSNKLVAGAGLRDGIIVSRPLAMSFECEFSTYYDDVKLNYTADAGLVDVSFDFGDEQPDAAFFSYALEFYSDDSYTDLFDIENDVVVVGNTIYGAIENQVVVDGLVFTIESCTITDASIGEDFALIDNQCPNSIVNAQVESYSDAEQVRFNFMSFLFPGSGEESVLNFSCEVVVCDAAASDTVCSTDPGCTARKRRSADAESAYTFTASKKFTVRK